MKWEYKAIALINNSNSDTLPERLTVELNKYANLGWELISFDLRQDCFIFKRLKNDKKGGIIKPTLKGD